MNIKILSIASVLALGMLACTSSDQPANDDGAATEEPTATTESVDKAYTVDPASSEVSWKGQMVGGAYYHTGTLQLASGDLVTNGGKVTGGKFAINWSSLATTDDNYSEEQPAANLIGHLKSAAFFATDSLGAATFEITGMEGNDIVGNMTIRGITNPEKVTDVSITEDENGVSASGKMTFDRQKYEVSYANTYSDAVISDDIEIGIKFSGK